MVTHPQYSARPVPSIRPLYPCDERVSAVGAVVLQTYPLGVRAKVHAGGAKVPGGVIGGIAVEGHTHSSIIAG